MGHLFQFQCLGKDPSVGVHMVYYGYGNLQGKWLSLSKGKVAFIWIYLWE